MITIKCPQCGTQLQIDEKTAYAKCNVCGYVATIEKDAPDIYKNLLDEKAKLEKELSAVIESYEKTGGVKDVHTVIEGYEKYKNIPGFGEIWSAFILGVTGASAARKDKELQTYLKNHAKKYDTENLSKDSNLYTSILQSYPNVGTNNDWDELIKQTHGDEAKFTVLSENIINYIVKAKDKAFAMDIFNLLAAKESDWSDAGRIYLRTLLSSEEIAGKVFPRTAFNHRTKKFILKVKAYCKKYLDNSNQITLEETKVWNNYTAACKMQKRRNVAVVTITAVVAVAVCVGTFVYLNATDKDTVKFEVDKVIEITYGDSLDLSGYTVTYNKNSGTTVTEQITEKMIKGYDPELVGTQQTVYVEFAGVRTGITVLVNPATLATPVLVQSGNYITWEFVPNAESYNIYVNSSSVITDVTTSLSYDLSENANYGELAVTVRANAGSNKYNNSAMSEAVTVTKLQPPSNIRYQDGKLTWDSVEGALSYELSINGTPYTISTNYFEIDLMQGDNEVIINAKPSSASAIGGYTKQNLYYFRLSPITSMSYKDDNVYWEADENAKSFSIYVDGTYWKDFNRNYFSVDSDGFAEEFGVNEHIIGVVCKSSLSGTEPSDMVSYKVAIGNFAYIEDNALKWQGVGTGATYFVKVNDASNPYSLSNSYLSLSDVQWKEGVNTVSITASYANQTIILETITLTKLTKPVLTYFGGSLMPDANPGNMYSLNNGAWTDVLPDISGLSVGDYTLRAQRVAAAGTFEINSDITELTFCKLAVPVISYSNDAISCTYDDEKYSLNLYCSDTADGDYTKISNLTDIHAAGTYYIKANLSASDVVALGYDFVIESDYSLALSVTKLEAPLVYYTQGEAAVTSNVSGVKFYYVYNDEEVELKGGLIANLPKGIFEIYARKIAEESNELTSDNTPVDKRVSVFNMNITLTISKMSSSQSQLYIVFGGCDEIDELTFSYEFKYYDKNGEYIGNKLSQSATTIQKNDNISTSNIVTTLNYRLDVVFEPGYSQTDIYSVEFIVTISSGSEGQQLSDSIYV